ncbi:unnamed protein product [Owenia fusiformis]|nr:unnamed protein product [Owenia fusiformis]
MTAMGYNILQRLPQGKDYSSSDYSSSTKTAETTSERLESLKEIVGSTYPLSHLMSRSDFYGTATINDTILALPETLEQLQNIVKAARTLGLKVRCIGIAGSWTPLWADKGQILMDLKNLVRHDGPRLEMNPVRYPNENTGSGTITALASVMIFELYDFMEQHDVTWLSGLAHDGGTLAGIISTGSVGSGINNPVLSEYAVAMRIVDSEGKLRSYNMIEHPEEMGALQCCLGMCGVIYDITVKVVPNAIARQRHVFYPTKELLMNGSNLRHLLEKNFNVQAHYSPMTGMTDDDWKFLAINGSIPASYKAENDMMWTKLLDTNDQELYSKEPVSPPYIWPHPMGTTPAPPSTTPATFKAHWLQALKDSADEVRSYFAETTYHTIPNALRTGSTDHMFKPVHGTQFFFPEDNNFTTSARLAKIITDIIQEDLEHPYGPFVTIVTGLIRWLKPSDPGCFLCPTNYRDATSVVSMEIVNAGLPPDMFFATSDKVSAKLLKEFPHARTHWAKEFEFGIKENIVKRTFDSYGYLLQQFKAIRHMAKWDTENMFTNELLCEIFYGVKHC